MKKMKTHQIILACSLLFALGSCNKGAVAPLTGEYPKPEEYTLNKVLYSNVEQSNGLFLFTLELSDEGVTRAEDGSYSGNGTVLKATFAGSSYFLHAASFTPASAGSLISGNYISDGEDAAAVISVSNGTATPKPISSGQLTVTKNGDAYTLGGVVWFEDESYVKLDFAGEIVYTKPELEPVALTNLFSVTNNVPNGTNTVTLKIASSGLTTTFNPTTFSYDITGTGNYISIDLYSADGTIAPGTYTPVAHDATIGAGNYVMGYDTEVDWGWGPMLMTNWGTCWFTVTDSVQAGQHITDGNIEVTQDGDNWRIYLNNGSIAAEYVGPINL